MSDQPTEPELPKSDPPTGLAAFWAELKRRHVVRVGIVYAIVGWLVIQVANATFEEFGIPLWAYRFVVLMVVLGFPISVVLAWAFELTPEGIKTTKKAQKENDESESHAKKRNWFSLVFAAAVPTLIFGTLAIFFYFRSPHVSPDVSGGGSSPGTRPTHHELVEFDKSIAVLPFTNMSANEEHAYFADGVHETILTNLANLGDIRVVSRTSVMQYRDTQKPIPVIGKELNVAYILEGSMQRSGNQFKLTTQFIEASQDNHLWAKDFTGELTDIFRVQADLAKDVASALQAVLSPEEQQQLQRPETASLEAYELYLEALEIYNNSTYERSDEIVELLDRAVSLDQTFTDAWLFIARENGRNYMNQQREPSIERKTKQAIDMAQRLEPNNPRVLLGLGYYHYNCHYDYTRARFYMEQARAKLPNSAEVLLGLASVNRRDGKWAEALNLYEKAHGLDPKDSELLYNWSNTCNSVRDWAKATELYDTLIAIQPNYSLWKILRATTEYYANGTTEVLQAVFADEKVKNDHLSRYYNWLLYSGNIKAFEDEGIIDSWDKRSYLVPVGRGLGGRFDSRMKIILYKLLKPENEVKDLLEFLVKEVKSSNDDTFAGKWVSLGNLAFIYGMLGQQEKAQNALDQQTSLRPESEDAFFGARQAYWRVLTLAWMGKKDEAVAEIAQLTRRPNRSINYYRLKNGLDFHPLRDHPGFQALLDDPALKQPVDLDAL